MITAATTSADGTRELGAALAGLVHGGDVVLLAGELGAGKTTLAQGFGRALGVDEAITSPTFTLMRSYEGRALRLLHCDIYRLDHLQEIIDLGLAELVEDDSVALVEWGDMAEAVLPADFLEVRISYGDEPDDDRPDDDGPAGDEPDDDEPAGDDRRRFALRPVGGSWAARAAALQHAVGRWAPAP